MADILAWHERGTRYGIGVDPDDGLLRAGDPGVQLTWMDAKVGDWVVTPRIGKPVEINALWHFAHRAMARWHELLEDGAAAGRYANAANRIRDTFRARFWNSHETGSVRRHRRPGCAPRCERATQPDLCGLARRRAAL